MTATARCAVQYPAVGQCDPTMCSAGFVATTACGAMGDFQTCDSALPAVCAAAGGRRRRAVTSQALSFLAGRLPSGHSTVLAYSDLNADATKDRLTVVLMRKGR